MSFSPQTGLVYLPARQTFREYKRYDKYVYREHFRNAGVTTPKRRFEYGASGSTPPDPPELKAYNHAFLLAWDPVAQKPAWTVPAANFQNGGTLATASGLVFWGDGDGHLFAFDAKDGKKLADINAGMMIYNAPMTYAVDGEQYVAVMTAVTINGPVKTVGLMPKSRILVYKVGGVATLPAYAAAAPMPAPPVIKASTAMLARGEKSFAENCSLCHGPDAMGTGAVPDLRRSLVLRDKGAFLSVVHGARADLGMPDFRKWIKPDEAEALRAYLAAQAGKLYAAEQKPK
jgi:mono/diheme cytochrome c family protein